MRERDTSLAGHPYFKHCFSLPILAGPQEMPCTVGSVCPRPDVTGKRCRYATNTLAQMAGRKVDALGMDSVLFQSSSILLGYWAAGVKAEALWVQPASAKRQASMCFSFGKCMLRMSSTGCRCLCPNKSPLGSFGIDRGRGRHFWTCFILL